MFDRRHSSNGFSMLAELRGGGTLPHAIKMCGSSLSIAVHCKCVGSHVSWLEGWMTLLFLGPFLISRETWVIQTLLAMSKLQRLTKACRGVLGPVPVPWPCWSLQEALFDERVQLSADFHHSYVIWVNKDSSSSAVKYSSSTITAALISMFGKGIL